MLTPQRIISLSPQLVSIHFYFSKPSFIDKDHVFALFVRDYLMGIPCFDSLDPLFLRSPRKIIWGVLTWIFSGPYVFLLICAVKNKNGFRSKASHFRWGGKAQPDQRLLAYHFWEGQFFFGRIYNLAWVIDSLKLSTRLKPQWNLGFWYMCFLIFINASIASFSWR